jgi:hypothetical protein
MICIIPFSFKYPVALSTSALAFVIYFIFFLHKVTLLRRGVRAMFLLGILTFLVEVIWIVTDLNNCFLFLSVFCSVDQSLLGLLRFSLWFLYFGIILFRLMKSLIREPFVTTSVVMGAGAGYLMIGFVGGVLLNTIYYLQPQAFVHLPHNPAAILNIAAFGYLTTLGSSVINQKHLFGQVAALFITLGGQLYVAILIALVLSRYHRRRS